MAETYQSRTHSLLGFWPAGQRRDWKLTGFQNRFHVMWNARAMLKLHAGNSMSPQLLSRKQVVSHVTKALQVVRKRQRMHDRKRFEGRHRSLSISLSISFLSFSLAMRDYASREGDTKRIESLLR